MKKVNKINNVKKRKKEEINKKLNKEGGEVFKLSTIDEQINYFGIKNVIIKKFYNRREIYCSSGNKLLC